MPALTRRSTLVGLVAAVTLPAVTSQAAAVDPLLAKIREYQQGLADFNELSGDYDDEFWSALAEKTYGPPLDELSEWTAPAVTLEGAIEALCISQTDDGGVYGCDAADRMVEAALGYLRAQATLQRRNV